MQNRVLILVGLLSGFLCRAPAHAQVTYDPRALEPLNPTAKTTPPPAATGNHTPPRNGAPARHPEATARKNPEKPSERMSESGEKAGIRRGTEQFGPPRPPPVTAGTLAVPPAPPPTVVIPPPIAVPVRPPPPPIPATVSADAAGMAAPIKDGVRITFGAGSSDLNPATEAAIRAVLKAAPPSDATTFNVTAFAAGTPDDPSTARRVSLSRALAVRSVMIEQGVASVRIYVKALGAAPEPGPPAPPDRVDIAVVAPPPGARPP